MTVNAINSNPNLSLNNNLTHEIKVKNASNLNGTITPFEFNSLERLKQKNEQIFEIITENFVHFVKKTFQKSLERQKKIRTSS